VRAQGIGAEILFYREAVKKIGAESPVFGAPAPKMRTYFFNLLTFSVYDLMIEKILENPYSIFRGVCVDWLCFYRGPVARERGLR
jgi:hypothetical protein